MSQDISLLIAFFAGIFSFLSPCVLPIVPGFISYILGKSFADIQDASQIEKIKCSGSSTTVRDAMLFYGLGYFCSFTKQGVTQIYKIIWH